MKNRFWPKTKLTEAEFAAIVECWCGGMTATESADVLEARGMKVSRQSIEKKFLELGDYIFRKFTLPVAIRHVREAYPDARLSDAKIEDAELSGLWGELTGKVVHSEFRKRGVPYPNQDIVNVLRERWRKFNGLSMSTFRSHVGFAALMTLPTVKRHPEAAQKFVLVLLEHDPL
jgi:hypothetical protein